MQPGRAKDEGLLRRGQLTSRLRYGRARGSSRQLSIGFQTLRQRDELVALAAQPGLFHRCRCPLGRSHVEIRRRDGMIESLVSRGEHYPAFMLLGLRGLAM